MRHSLLILATAGTLAGCATTPSTTLGDTRGLEAPNVPVVTRQDFAFDASAPGGFVTTESAARLDGWFQGLNLTYGDQVYVEGAGAGQARADVARVAGRYGMLVSDGGPVVAGEIAPGTVRVVVTRARASVPNCPNWDDAVNATNFENRGMTNFGCGVNANLAAMVANPEDLLHGREGSGVGDAITSAKAVGLYRGMKPTGGDGLKDISTKGK